MNEVTACVNCGSAITQAKYGPRRKYCESKECRRVQRSHHAATPRSAKPTKTCDTCGNPCFGTRCQPCRRSALPNCPNCGEKVRKIDMFCCSRKCSVEYKRKLRGAPATLERECEECGSVFVPSHKRTGSRAQRFCSVACRYTSERSARRLNPPPPKPTSKIYIRACIWCSCDFAGRSASARMCSDKCRRLRQIARAADRIKGVFYSDAIDFDALTGRYTGKGRRDALIAYLVDRDGDKCGICHRHVDITLKSGTKGSRRGPSVDHIIPRSLGGSDDLANLRLAHWGCNQKRGNRIRSEQLALVG